MTISSDTLPISLLESAHKAFDPLELGIQSVLHSRRWPIAVGDFAYVLAAQAKRAGDATYGPVVKFFPVNRRSHIIWQRDNDSSGDVPLGNSKYLDADISVNKKMREQVTGAVRLPLGDRIWELRKTRGLTQTQLAEILGVRQSAVARWETSKDRPLPQTLIKISELVNEEERQWWRDLAAESAGFGEAGGSTLPEVSFSRTIPLIKTHNKVGILGSVDPLDVEVNLTLPAEWFPESGSIRAVRINANSISPLVDGAYIAVIDISRRDADRLVGCMVAIQTTVTPVTKQDIINNVETALLAASWTTISGHATTNLLMQSATTPQGFAIRIRLKDNGGNCVTFSLESTDGVLVGGNSTTVGIFLFPNAGGWVYRITCNKYQAFVYVTPNPVVGRTFAAFGVPFLPTWMAAITTRVGWLQGNAANDTDTTFEASFRGALSGSSAFSFALGQQAMYNSALWTLNGNSSSQIGIVAIPSYVCNTGANTGVGFRWENNSALLIDALISWGSTASNVESKFKGQLWDGLVSTDVYAGDDTAVIDGHNWIVITDNGAGFFNSQRGTLLIATS